MHPAVIPARVARDRLYSAAKRLVRRALVLDVALLIWSAVAILSDVFELEVREATSE